MESIFTYPRGANGINARADMCKGVLTWWVGWFFRRRIG